MNRFGIKVPSLEHIIADFHFIATAYHLPIENTRQQLQEFFHMVCFKMSLKRVYRLPLLEKKQCVGVSQTNVELVADATSIRARHL